MPDSSPRSSQVDSFKITGKRLFTILTILLVTAGTLWLIFSTQPKAVRVGATKKTAMLVEVVEVERGNFHPIIEGLGAVQPSKDILLRPEVAGRVTSMAESFVPGGFVKKGETLLQIDPSDYRNALAQQKAALQQAQAELDIEMGLQEAARNSYALLDEELPSDKEALVLRKPQLEALEAKVESARAAVKQAERNLWRTTVQAPFDAHVLSRSVNVGSQVSTSSELGRLVGWRTYWVKTSVPLSKLQWLEFPEKDRKGAEVRVRNRSSWSKGAFRTGRLYKLVGALEEKTRLARVLVEVEDPLSHLSEHAGEPVLMIGSFVETRIQGKQIENVVRIDLDHLRKNDTVWVMKDGALDIREANVLLRGTSYAYISEGLEDGERIVTTSLASVVQGAPLRLKEEPVK